MIDKKIPILMALTMLGGCAATPRTPIDAPVQDRSDDRYDVIGITIPGATNLNPVTFFNMRCSKPNYEVSLTSSNPALRISMDTENYSYSNRKKSPSLHNSVHEKAIIQELISSTGATFLQPRNSATTTYETHWVEYGDAFKNFYESCNNQRDARIAERKAQEITRENNQRELLKTSFAKARQNYPNAENAGYASSLELGMGRHKVKDGDFIYLNNSEYRISQQISDTHYIAVHAAVYLGEHIPYILPFMIESKKQLREGSGLPTGGYIHTGLTHYRTVGGGTRQAIQLIAQ